jgi:hypothetical protein
MIRSLLACGLVLLSGRSLRAVELPTAESILEKEVAAAGGKAAAEKVRTTVLKAKGSVQDVTVDMLVQLAPNRYRMDVTIEGISKDEFVVSGDVVWKKSSITGTAVLQGAERADVAGDAAEFAHIFQRVGNWRKQFKETKCVAEETIGGKAAYKVELTTRDGQTRVDHYDKDSGLLLRTERAVETPQGKVNKIELYSDYRKVDGLMHPFTIRITEDTTEVVLTIEEVKHNVDIQESTFAPPAELKKQLEQ